MPPDKRLQHVKYASPEYWRLYRQIHGDKLRENKRRYDSERYKNHPETERARRRRYAEANQEKIAAHVAVAAALKRKNGLTRLPCEMCGTSRRVVAHHDDYSKQLDVRWLCEIHHKAHHRELLA